MKHRHLIDSAVFDIGFSSEETAFEMQSELNGFISKQLMPVVAEVFDASSKGDTLLRIPVIELDLGAVPYADYHHELPRRLREKLAELLAEIRQSIGAKAAANNQSLDRATSRRELVEYFLLHGHLPWYASLAKGETVEQLLIKQLTSEPQALSLFLQSTVHKQLVSNRLVAQFHQQVIHKIVQLLAPNHAERIKQLAELFLMLWRRDDSAFTKPVQTSEIGRRLWSNLILVLLGKGSRQFSAEQLFEQVLLSLLPELREDVRPLLNRLNNFRDNKIDITGLQSMLSRLIEKQSVVDDPKTGFAVDVNTELKLDGEARLAQLGQQLVAAIVSGEFSNIEASWSELLADHVPLLEQALRHYGQQAQIRKRIAYGFPEPVLQQLLLLIEPTEHAFVARVIDQPSLFQLPNEGAVSVSLPAPERVRKQLWQFSLGYLLVERGSRFNKKSYLGSLLRQMAMANNMSHAEMLAGLSGHVAALPTSNAIATEMLQLLTELRQELENGRPETEIEEATHLSGYECYDELIQALNQAGEFTQIDSQRLISKLESKTPWLLQRLIRELHDGSLGNGVQVSLLSAEQLRQLLFAFIRISNQSEASGQSELINAIETYSGQSTELKHYYQQILQCLLQGELIDFETILSGSASVETLPVVEKSAVQKNFSKLHKQQPPVFENDEKALLQYLRGDASVAGSEASALIKAFENLLDQHPQSLRRILVELIADKQMMARLLSLLPERLLSRSLSLMGMRDVQRLQQYAEIITTACHNHELRLNQQRLTGFKWQLIFTYFKDVGLLFNEKQFVEYFLAGLADLIEMEEQPDSQGFTAVVSQQLVANSLPSTRDIMQKIVQCLAETTDQPVELKPTQPKTENTVPETELDKQVEFEELPLEDIHIANAGIVLAAPYLPRLFEMLGLTEKSAFKNSQAAERGVHMLQYLVDEHIDSPEYQLVLNKLLCGIKTGIPIERQISLSLHEEQQLEGLLQGMTQNWKSLGNTSIAGLRQSFLQRQGRLQLRDDAWHLLVEAKPYDMLLDQIPWSFSTIKFPWMERVIYVDWR